MDISLGTGVQIPNFVGLEPDSDLEASALLLNNITQATLKSTHA